MLEILRSWLSHALDCVPSLPLITGEQSLFVVGGMPKMLPTLTIMRNLIELLIVFQAPVILINLKIKSALKCYSAS